MKIFRPDNFLKNQRGDTMIAVIIVAAVALTVLSVMTSQLVHSQRSEQLARHKAELNILLGDMVSSLASPEFCRASIPPLNLTGFEDPAAAPRPFTLAMPWHNGNIVLSPNATIDNQYRVERLTVQYYAAGTHNGVRMIGNVGGAPTELTRRVGTVELVLSRLNGMGGTESMKPYQFEMGFYVDNTNIIRACTTEAGNAETCMRLGNVWNPAAMDAEQKCMPANYCRTAGSYSPPSASGNPFPNPMTSSYGCPDGAVAVQSSVVTEAQGCGKYCAQNAANAVYTCMYCGGEVMARSTIYEGTTGVQQIDISEKIKEMQDQDVAGTEACYLLRVDRNRNGLTPLPPEMESGCPNVTAYCAGEDTGCSNVDRRINITNTPSCLACVPPGDPRNGAASCAGRTSPYAPSVNPADPDEEEQVVDNKCCGNYVCSF